MTAVILSYQAMAQVAPFEPKTVVVKLRATAGGEQSFVADRSLGDLMEQIGAASVKPLIEKPYTADPSSYPSFVRVDELRRREAEVARIFVVRYASEESPPLVARRFALLPSVEYAEPKYLMMPLGPVLTPDDSLFAQQAFLKTIHAEEAWDVTQGDTTVIIAIADTDIRWDHPDLEANIWRNKGETGTDGQGRDKRTNGVDDDLNGFIDDWHGWDFAGATGNAGDNDTRANNLGHGTAVAGLAGAVTNNRIGIASIGNRCRILPIKIGADGGGSLAYGYDAMDYASKLGARVFNASWGSFAANSAAEDVINMVTARGMLVVGGAGNHGSTAPFYPASYPAVLDAGVTDAADIISGASAYGPTVDVMTPGQGALSISASGGYSVFGATSAAAPIASGVAGLVASHFPSYSPHQIRERIRVTSDNIDAKNPARARFAGKGRVNAARAVSDPPTPSLRIAAFLVGDPNSDGRLEPGEDLTIRVDLKNYLDATPGDVTLTLVPAVNASNVSVIRGTATIPAIGAGGAGSTATDAFLVRVEPSTNYDAKVILRLDIASGGYDDFDFITIAVNPSYRTMHSNQLALTIHANGMLGYSDYPDNTMGDGMRYGTATAQLFIASAMIGTDASHVVDNARSATDFLSSRGDFRRLDPVQTADQTNGAREKTASRFSDAGADSARRLNVEVMHEAFDYSNQGVPDVLLSKYTVKNTGPAALAGLRFGLCMDFGGINYYVANAAYDSARHFGWIDKSGAAPLAGTFVIDTLALTDPKRSNFWAINNDHRVTQNNPFGTLDGFTDAEKWRALSSFGGNRTTAPGNLAYVITAPAADIAPGESAVLVFGQAAGNVLATIRRNVDAAIALWRNPAIVSAENPATPAEGILLGQNHPNPAGVSSPGTVITFTLPQGADIRCEVFTLLGERVATLADGWHRAGEHRVRFSAAGLPAGTYVYRLTSGADRAQKLLTIVR